MKLNRVHVAVMAALTGAGGLTAQTASAQQGGLEEIVVTATRRSENLQEVPISIVAITGEGLEMRGLDNLERVSQGVPNVIITGGGGGTGGTVFRMRGIPGVGTYVDGVWQVATGGFLTQEFVDIDRVEVLRGPQGTMFGRDSTGGALRIWTKRPADEFGGNVTVTAGSYDRRDVKGSIDLPFSDKLKTKFTGANLNRDGYIRSLTTGQYGGNIDQQVYRGDILWTPTEKLSFRINVQNDISTFVEPRVQDLIARTYDDPNPNWGKSIIGLPEMYTYVGNYKPGINGGAAVEPFFSSVNQVAGFPGGKVAKGQNRSGTVLPNDYTTKQASVDIGWQLSDNMKLTFLTATTKQDARSVSDWDNSQYDLVLDENLARTTVNSEEIQLTGGHGKLEWLGGVYYWDQTIKARGLRWQVNEFQKGLMDPNNVFQNPVCDPRDANGNSILTPVSPGSANMKFIPGSFGRPLTGYYAGQLVNLGGAPGTGAGAWQTCQQVYFGAIPGSFDSISRSGQNGWAGFFQATVHLTDKLDLTAGLRHHDQSGYTVNLTGNASTAAKPLDPVVWPNGDAFAGNDNKATYTPFSFDKDTTRLVLQRKFTDKVNGYVSYSEGYNSGGVSAANILGVRTLFPYKPSTLKNTEVGMRSDLANGKIRFNATIFSTIWADLQAAGVVTDPNTGAQIPTLITTNVGEAQAKGVEIELTFAPTDNLLINLGIGSLDTAYTKVKTGTASGQIPINASTEFEDAPSSTYSIGLTHTANLKSGATFTTRVDYNYQGQFWRSVPFLRTSAYAVVPAGSDESGDWGVMNLRFSYAPSGKNWTASFFGTNITNEYMINSGFFHGIWGYDFATVGRPREAGASLTYRF
jgi:iron complex outermembrane recepter protein